MTPNLRNHFPNTDTTEDNIIFLCQNKSIKIINLFEKLETSYISTGYDMQNNLKILHCAIARVTISI